VVERCFTTSCRRLWELRPDLIDSESSVAGKVTGGCYASLHNGGDAARHQQSAACCPYLRRTQL